MYRKFVRLTAVAVGVVGVSAACQASASTLFTFANYDQRKSFNTDVTWTRNTTTKTGGVIVSTDQGAHSGTASPVSFTFVDPSAGALHNTPLVAVFSLNAFVPSSTPAFVQGGNDVQPGVQGTFSFIFQGGAPVPGQSHQSMTFGVGPGAITITNGAVLLTGKFTGASIIGSGATGDLVESTLTGGTLSYSSPFLAFDTGSPEAFDLHLTSVTPTFRIDQPGRAMTSFAANSTGKFYTEVPEPASWVLTLVGFGMLGAALRRSGRVRIAA